MEPLSDKEILLRIFHYRARIMKKTFNRSKGVSNSNSRSSRSRGWGKGKGKKSKGKRGRGGVKGQKKSNLKKGIGYDFDSESDSDGENGYASENEGTGTGAEREHSDNVVKKPVFKLCEANLDTNAEALADMRYDRDRETARELAELDENDIAKLIHEYFDKKE